MISNYSYQVPDFRGGNGNWVRSNNPAPNVTQHTRAGKLWVSINERCKVGGYVQNRSPTYIGCTNGFKDFQEFAEWCQHQYGYTNKGENGRFWSLDKDLKVIGNKLYSPETCIFVPQRVNCLLTLRGSCRGDYPLGVSWNLEKQKFVSQCGNGSNSTHHLGYFTCPLEAHRAWQRDKAQYIRKICAEDEEIRNHLELVPILLAQAARIEHDVLNNIETK